LGLGFGLAREHLALDLVRHHLLRALLHRARAAQRVRRAAQVAEHHLLVGVLCGVLRLARVRVRVRVRVRGWGKG